MSTDYRLKCQTCDRESGWMTNGHGILVGVLNSELVSAAFLESYVADDVEVTFFRTIYDGPSPLTFLWQHPTLSHDVVIEDEYGNIYPQKDG